MSQPITQVSVPRNSGLGTAVVTAVPAFLWIILIAVLLFVVPAQRRMYDEFGMRLPTVSQLAIDLSAFVGEYWWLVVPAISIFLILVCASIYFLRERGSQRWLATVLMLFASLPPALVLALMTLGHFIARMKLAEALSR